MYIRFFCGMITILSAISSTHAWSDGRDQVAKERYAIVVSKDTNDLPEWSKVVDALREKHHATRDVEVIVYDAKVAETLARLKSSLPRYTCFVARHEEANRQFVATVHQLCRRLDEDPYADTFWGILTGFDAANALSIAVHAQPLTIERVASGTEVLLDACREGVWYCELVKNKMVRKLADGQPQEEAGPSDTTKSLAETLSQYKAQLFVTSGHATERNWQIGFRYRNGYFRSKNGQLLGEDTTGDKFKINSSNPKVYLPIGNCLMGNIDGPDAMALAFLNSAGVKQMIGYTVPTWFGYGGWGMLDYFVEQPGRYTMNEAFFANHHALIHRLHVKSIHERPGDRRGLEFDRDVVAFYGDPAWSAKMASGPLRWQQDLASDGKQFTLTIKPLLGEASFQPPNTNGAQRGYRPIVAFLPRRVSTPVLQAGQELRPTITDDFVLIPNPRICDPAKSYTVQFTVD